MSDSSSGAHELPDDPPHPAAAPRPTFAPGDSVPHLSSWILERKLGGGGFGEVWLTRHAWNLKEPLRAVKFCTDPYVRHRLVTHEKNVVLRVMKYAGDHPNIVPLLDCNLDGELPWLMYEYVEGGTLAHFIGEWRALPLSKRLGRAVRTLHALAGALGACHRLDPPLVHRDLKPANVLMAGGKVPRITDFGIGSVVVHKDDGATNALTAFMARVPTGLRASGTRLYAPPEQLFGAPPSPRDDVYALGVIAFQMIVGDPTAAPGPDATLELRDLRIPTELATLVVRSVAMNADRRPRDASEWEAALAKFRSKARSQPDIDPAAGARPAAPVTPTERPPPRTVATPPRVLPPEVDVDLSEPTPRPPRAPRKPPAAPARTRARAEPPPRAWGGAKVLGCLAVLLGFGALAAVGGKMYLDGKRNPDEAKKTDGPKKDAPTPGVGAFREPAPGETRDVEIAPGVKMTFCWVPAGRATLGSPADEKDRGADEAERAFETRGFWMAKYEVTQAEWAAVMRGTEAAAPSAFRVGGPEEAKLGAIADTDRFPVDSVSWDDCQEFLKRVNARGGVQNALGRAGVFALPTEGEWEYACRGGKGNARPFYFGAELDGAQANCDGTSPYGTDQAGEFLQRPAPAGSYAAKFPHPWGLCDLHGNVAEWCETAYDGTDERVLRGGSWNDQAVVCRSACRDHEPPDGRHNDCGFRVCIRFDPPPGVPAPDPGAGPTKPAPPPDAGPATKPPPVAPLPKVVEPLPKAPGPRK